VPASTKLTIPLGRTCPIAWSYTSDGTTPVSIASVTDIVLTIRAGASVSSALLVQKSLLGGGVTISDAAAGLATITLAAGDTAGLTPGTYAYDVKVLFVDGSIDFPSIGSVVLTDHPGR
jgi:hypothetical protein